MLNTILTLFCIMCVAKAIVRHKLIFVYAQSRHLLRPCIFLIYGVAKDILCDALSKLKPYTPYYIKQELADVSASLNF